MDNHNELHAAKSPYLRQHSKNPVNWKAWSEEVFLEAGRLQKLVLVSIGYSSCHWCHVMEKESFSDPEVAAEMNEHYICIKVDREEHPDIDHYYMEAVQIMSGQGGWPLNCFVLPDKRPVYGGTYFPKKQWLQVLRKLHDIKTSEGQGLLEYAERLSAAMKEEPIVTEEYDKARIRTMLNSIPDQFIRQFDSRWGGTLHVPKFPLPGKIACWMLSGYFHKREELTAHALFTLRKICNGGIFDHVGGGFARYATDEEWKVPHFEKMLYDNAQMLSVLADAVRTAPEGGFQEEIRLTAEFLEREMKAPEGGFYAAIDADSEGEEGKFYVWTREALKNALGNKFESAQKWFRLSASDAWEDGKYILTSGGEIDQPVRDEIRAVLLAARSKRVRPLTDDKIILSWNALAVKGMADAYLATGEASYLNLALDAMRFIRSKMIRNGNNLWHVHARGESYIEGYLEDYAFLTGACISLNHATADPGWLVLAKSLTDVAIEKCYDPGVKNFRMSATLNVPVPQRDMVDNVIPSPVSVMCSNLFYLAQVFDNERYREMASALMFQALPMTEKVPSGYYNWVMVAEKYAEPERELIVTGKDAAWSTATLMKSYLPHYHVAAAAKENGIPVFAGRPASENAIYVCENRSCRLPVSTAGEALKLIQQG